MLSIALYTKKNFPKLWRTKPQRNSYMQKGKQQPTRKFGPAGWGRNKDSYLGDEHGLELQLVEEYLGFVRGGRARRNRHVDPLLLERVNDAPGVPEKARRIPLGPALAVEIRNQSVNRTNKEHLAAVIKSECGRKETRRTSRRAIGCSRGRRRRGVGAPGRGPGSAAPPPSPARRPSPLSSPRCSNGHSPAEGATRAERRAGDEGRGAETETETEEGARFNTV